MTSYIAIRREARFGFKKNIFFWLVTQKGQERQAYRTARGTVPAPRARL